MRLLLPQGLPCNADAAICHRLEVTRPRYPSASTLHEWSNIGKGRHTERWRSARCKRNHCAEWSRWRSAAGRRDHSGFVRSGPGVACQWVCQWIETELFGTIRYRPDGTVAFGLFSPHEAVLDSTGRMVLISLSRWRHGFESRTGCQENTRSEPLLGVALLLCWTRCQSDADPSRALESSSRRVRPGPRSVRRCRWRGVVAVRRSGREVADDEPVRLAVELDGANPAADWGRLIPSRALDSLDVDALP
jgi:hypothetical protein